MVFVMKRVEDKDVEDVKVVVWRGEGKSREGLLDLDDRGRVFA